MIFLSVLNAVSKYSNVDVLIHLEFAIFKGPNL